MNNLLSDSFKLSEGDASGDIEMGTVPVSNVESGLEGFFKKIKGVEKEIEKLSNILKKLQDANEESKNVTSPAAMKAIKHQMEKDTDEALKVARLAKSKVEELERENSASRQKPGTGPGSSVDRSRTSTTDALKRKLKDKITEFQTLREKIAREYRDVVERRVFTVTGTHADEETIDQLIETGNSEQIFQKAIQEQGRGQVLNTIAEIQERYDAVKEVEKKLLELQQLFVDMSVLVDSQGDMLNNIEAEVSKTVDHVNSGVKALQKARVLQKSTRKWTCIAIIILLIIILAIVLSIKPWKK